MTNYYYKVNSSQMETNITYGYENEYQNTYNYDMGTVNECHNINHEIDLNYDADNDVDSDINVDVNVDISVGVDIYNDVGIDINTDNNVDVDIITEDCINTTYKSNKKIESLNSRKSYVNINSINNNLLDKDIQLVHNKMSDQIQKSEKEKIEETKRICDSFNAIIKRFKVLSELQAGYKLWLTIEPATADKQEVKKFEIDNTYVQPITRWWNSQSREPIINTIIDDANYIVENYPKLNDKGQIAVSNAILGALQGLNVVKHTYSQKSEHREALGKVVETLTVYATYQKN